MINNMSVTAQDATAQNIVPGYKQSDIGVIPVEWEVNVLGNRIDIAHGFPFNSQYFVSHGFYRLTTPGHFYEEGGFRDVGEKQKYYSGFVPYEYILHPGDLIIAMTEQADGLLGSAALIPRKGSYLHNQRLGKVKPISDEIDLHFLYYIFNSEYFRSKVRETAAGTKVKHTSPTKLLDIKVSLPPLPEQRAIAAALSDIDALIEALDTLIDKQRAIKQATMQQLLTGKTRLPGFSGAWEIKKIREVASVKTGPFGSALHERDYVEDGTPIITVEHLGEFGVIQSNLPRVSETDRKRLNSYSLQVGDIVFSRVGAIDRNALIRSTEAGWLFSGRLLRVRPDQACIFPSYLSYHFHSESFKALIREVAVGQTMASLNTRILQEIEVTLPSYSEQTAIAAVLSDMDAEIAALEQRRDKTQHIKQGMMQQLLTGKVRLV